jgi:HK97 family phage major capsid protein
MHNENALLGAMNLVPLGVVMNVAPSLEDLQARVDELNAASDDFRNRLEAGEELTDDETSQIEANADELTKLTKQINARKLLEPKGRGRATSPEPRERGTQNGTALRVPAEPRDTARGGFKSFGEFALAVRKSSIAGNQPDNRLLNTTSTYGGEGSGTDGGFDVFPDFRRDIWQKVIDQEVLLNRCAQLVTASNSIVVPKDETTPWQTSGGILAYWEAEAAAVTASKPALQMEAIRLAKLMALVPVSDELLEDGVGLESWLRAKAPAKMAAKINTAIVRGTGVGQPMGILTALTTGSTISVAKETSQPANTIYFANINKMWARMYAPCRRNAVWLINQDIEPQLDAMAFDPAATSKVPVYLPPGGVSNADYATLKGRPVVPIESCSTLSTQGDIILVDLSQYWAVTKGTDVRTDVSMHLFFDQGLQAFRFTFRVNGQPIWGSSITPENGSNTRSWAVTLDAR